MLALVDVADVFNHIRNGDCRNTYLNVCADLHEETSALVFHRVEDSSNQRSERNLLNRPYCQPEKEMQHKLRGSDKK